MKRILVVLLCSLLNITQAAAVIVLITAVPTGAGVVSSKFRDGNDGGAAPPSAPEMSQPAVIDDDSASIPLLTACTGGTAPLAYEIEKSSTSSVAGWAVHATGITFTDGLYTIAALAASTQYWVRLACVDAASRRSAYSSVFQFTTPADVGGDTEAPTAPTITSLTSPSAGTALLTWTNGTDNVAVTESQITRALGTGAGGTCDVQATGNVIATVSSSVLSYQDLALIEGQEYAYRVKHNDAAGNIGPNSSPRECVVITAGSAGTSVKWHPGHYMLSDSRMTTSSLGYTASHITAIAGNANIIGIEQRVMWSVMETSRGVYDFSKIDTLLGLAQASGKRLLILVLDTTFSGTSTSHLPAYLATEPGADGGWCVKDNNAGVKAKTWLPAVMDREIALAQALAGHIIPNSGGLTYDTHPYFEGITGSESAVGIPLGTCGTLSGDAGRAQLATQLKRWVAGVKPFFPNTNVFSRLNYLQGQMAGASGLVENAKVLGAGVSGPDTVPGSPVTSGLQKATEAQCIIMGESWVPNTPIESCIAASNFDYRGDMPLLWDVQTPELGGKEGTFAIADIGLAGDFYGATHMAWVRTTQAAPKPNWLNDIYPYLQGTPVVLETLCPPIYSSCNTN